MLKRIPMPVRTWLAVLGAPVVFTLQFVLGFGISQWQCNAAGQTNSIPVDTWTAIATVLSGLVALAGIVAGVSVMAETKAAEHPPLERHHFMAVCSLTFSGLILAVILLGGLGVLNLTNCVQS